MRFSGFREQLLLIFQSRLTIDITFFQQFYRFCLIFLPVSTLFKKYGSRGRVKLTRAAHKQNCFDHLTVRNGIASEASQKVTDDSQQQRRIRTDALQQRRICRDIYQNRRICTDAFQQHRICTRALQKRRICKSPVPSQTKLKHCGLSTIRGCILDQIRCTGMLDWLVTSTPIYFLCVL